MHSHCVNGDGSGDRMEEFMLSSIYSSHHLHLVHMY